MGEILTALAFAAAIFMGISIGASSIAPAFGPVNSSGAENILRAALLGGIFALIGSVVQGRNVTETIGSGILIGEITLLQGTIILFIGAALVIISVLTDYPMPTAFTVTGAVIGSAVGFGDALNYDTIAMIIGYWVMVPIVALFMSYGIAVALRHLIPKEGSERFIQALLLVSGAYMAYTTGAGSVGLAVGPLQSMDLELNVVLIIGGLAIMAGSWMYSPRIIKAVSRDYTNLGPRRSIAALGTAAVLAQVGIQMGAPISANLAIIASVIGSGMVEGKSNMERGKILFTAVAWVGAFFLSIALTAGIGLLIQ